MIDRDNKKRNNKNVEAAWKMYLLGKILRRSHLIVLLRNCSARIGRYLLGHGRLCLLAALFAFLPFLFVIWVTGLYEFFYEIPFTQFQWPPHVDVRKEVIMELLGKHTDISPINLWANYHPLIQPSCKQNRLTRKRSILTIVKSAPGRIEQRIAVRATYGSSTQTLNLSPDYRMRTIFAMGRPTAIDSAEKMHNLEKEAIKYGDLLVGDFEDNYFNNTLKFAHSIGIAQNHCGGGPVPFLLLLDDDYLMFPWNLVTEAEKHVMNERLYMGWRYDSTPFRFRLRKYRVTLAEYPFNAYPPYITGGAVFMTGQTVSEFHAAIQHTAFFKHDDVYTGILAYLLGIMPQHNPAFYPFDHRQFARQDWWKVLIALHGYTPSRLRESYAEALKSWKESSLIQQQTNELVKKIP